MIKSTVILFMLLGYSVGQANDKRPADRFQKYLLKIEKVIQKYKYSNDLTNGMINEDLRTIFFKLEALTRTYKEQDPQFLKMHTEFKNFEDDLGSWEKWHSIYKRSGSTTFLRKRDRAWARIRESIRTGNWQKKHGANATSQQFLNFIQTYNFGGYQQDKSFVTATIASHIDILNGKTFDLTYLEQGNGLHELRKEVRWILHQVRYLRGLIQYKPKNICPIESFLFLVDSDARDLKYAQLSTSEKETDPCFISMCTFLSMAKAVDDLGDIKDKIEISININGTAHHDLVPRKYKKKVQQIHDILKNNNVFSILSGELRSCTL